VDALAQLGCKHAKGYGLAAQPRVASISLIMRSGGSAGRVAGKGSLPTARFELPSGSRIVADGFYECAKTPAGRKQPYFISVARVQPFAFAGLWESWDSPDGEGSRVARSPSPEREVSLGRETDCHHRIPLAPLSRAEAR
jgi:SOS response associated peptidase (SRAP)